MTIGIPVHMAKHYSATIRNTAERYNFEPLDISNDEQYRLVEKTVRTSEKEKGKSMRANENIISSRMGIALYNLSKGSFEHAAYSLARAGKDAISIRNFLLYAQLRHISSIMLEHIMYAEEFDPAVLADANIVLGEAIKRYVQISREACFGFVYAAESYLRQNHEKVGLRCWHKFKNLAIKTKFKDEHIRVALQIIRDRFSNLRESIDDYCEKVGAPLVKLE